jgi:hypothetical protein
MPVASPPVAPPASAARAEFRVFGHGLIAALQPLLFNGRTVLQQSRRMPPEVYLVPTVLDSANVKVRGGLLDLKVKIDQTPQGFEVFEPRGKWPLPAGAEALIAVQAALGVAEQAAPTASDLPGLLAWARACPALRVVTVEKQRNGFSLDGVVGEYAQVWMNGALLETVCLETEDWAALARLVDELQLSTHPNTSYVRAAQRLLGLF